MPLPIIADCSDCGACCTAQAALPVHLIVEWYRMDPCSPLPAELAAELRAAVERFGLEGWPADGTPCIWYDAAARRCRHYDHRPTLCREVVAPGDESCRRWRRSLGMDKEEG